MAGVNVKLGVEYSQFRTGMKDAQSAVQTLNEKLKANESQLKLTGDQELYLKNKVDILTQQINAQKAVVGNALSALKSLANNGVSPASAQYQKMESNLYKATDKLNKMQLELKETETGADKAGNEAEEMNTKLKKIGEGVSWQNVTEGLNSIISKLESGARSAINFGKKIYSSVKDSAGWADDLLTLSKTSGIDVTTLQQMQKVADIVDTDVDAIINAKKRMQKAATTEGGTKAIEEVLGISLNGQNAEDLFWEIGDALVHMEESFDKESAAQTVFGRSWSELVPLFNLGRESYEEMLGEQTTLTEDQVKKLGEADDAMVKVEQTIQDMKNAFWADNADTVINLLQWVLDNKDAVVIALGAITTGFAAMKIGTFATDLAKVIKGFSQLGLIKGGETATAAAAGQAGSAVPAAGAAAAGGGWMTGLMNNLVSGMGTSFVLGEEAKIRGMVNNFISGMSQEEAKAKGFQQTFGITQEEFDEWANQRNLEKQGSGASFDEVKYVNPVSDEIIYKDRRGTATVTGGAYESVDRMNEVASEMTDATQNQTNATNDMAAAAKSMTGLPALVGAAVQAGVSGIKVMMDGYTVGTLVAPTVSEIIAQNAK